MEERCEALRHYVEPLRMSHVLSFGLITTPSTIIKAAETYLGACVVQ